MSTDCCSPPASRAADPRYRRILWIALVVNVAMFAIEIGVGARSDSTSLLADAIDFLGDAANYGLSLAAIGMAAIWRPRAALAKALVMGAFGVGVVARVGYVWAHGLVPTPEAMGVVGVLALVANFSVAALLYAYRNGDADMRSVWLCTRNDVLGNLAVLAAALGVFGTRSAWPDLIVALGMAMLALVAARSIFVQARGELRALRTELRREPVIYSRRS